MKKNLTEQKRIKRNKEKKDTTIIGQRRKFLSGFCKRMFQKITIRFIITMTSRTTSQNLTFQLLCIKNLYINIQELYTLCNITHNVHNVFLT